MEQQGVVRDHEVATASQSLVDDSLGDIGAEERGLCLGGTVAHLQARVVVTLLQPGGRNRLYSLDYAVDCGHIIQGD